MNTKSVDNDTTKTETEVGMRELVLTEGADVLLTKPGEKANSVDPNGSSNEKSSTVGAESEDSATTKLVQLRPDEYETLGNYESIISRFSKSFVEVGMALKGIREGRLYRATHATFEDYLRGRWEMTPQRAGQLINAAEVAKLLAEAASTGPMQQPEIESQIRPLTRLKSIEERTAVWELATEKAGGQRVTAEQVETAIAELYPKSKSSSSGVHPARLIDQVEKLSDFITKNFDVKKWNSEQADELIKVLGELRLELDNVEAGLISRATALPKAE